MFIGSTNFLIFIISNKTGGNIDFDTVKPLVSFFFLFFFLICSGGGRGFGLSFYARG